MAPEDANIDLVQAETHLYFNAFRLDNGQVLKKDMFWPNFNIFASLLSKGHKDVPQTGGRKWQNLKIANCSDVDWVKNLPDTEPEKEYLMKDYFCINEPKINIFGGTTPTNHTKIMMDLYPCQTNNGMGYTCANLIPNYGIMVEVSIMEKSIDVKNYENPIKYTFRRLANIIGSDALRYETKIFMKDTELHTNKGQFIASWEKQKIATVHDVTSLTSDRHMRNVPLNFLSQGKAFNTDA